MLDPDDFFENLFRLICKAKSDPEAFEKNESEKNKELVKKKILRKTSQKICYRTDKV